jgi:hypothetical protein
MHAASRIALLTGKAHLELVCQGDENRRAGGSKTVLNRLSADGDLEKGVSPNFVVRNWPPAFKEWPTKVREAFYASPAFPRLLNAEATKDTIARGVENGMLACVGKTASGRYQPFAFKQTASPGDIRSPAESCRPS